MYLENLVFDAAQPQVRGHFWERVLGTQTLTDESDIVETRLSVDGGPTLDLCFQQVSDPLLPSPRLHLDLHAGDDQAATVQRLLDLGASRVDLGQDDVPWVVLADPEGHPFHVVEERDAYRDTGPIAAISILGDDPARDAAFWAGLTGWREYAGTAPQSLRHPSGRGPLLEFLRAKQDVQHGRAKQDIQHGRAKQDIQHGRVDEPKAGKNQLHLDLRLEAEDDLEALLDHVEGLGAVRLDHDWGDLPWTSLQDPSGNEFCFLPARSA